MASRGSTEFAPRIHCLERKKNLIPLEQAQLDQDILADIAQPFRWRSSKKDGNWLYLPSDMETRHVFYTLLMIWNHTMPVEARTKGYKQCSFGEFYTPEYMKRAVVAFVIELGTRTDMTAAWKQDLEHMLSWCRALKLV